MMQKAQRPCALLIRLKYKGKRYDFAVPFRSNISPASPKTEYFPLPPRAKTKPMHRHGLHYIKMFPVRRAWTIPYHTANNPEAMLYKSILNANEKRVLAECQKYLIDYENGIRSAYSTDLDLLISKMEQLK